MSLPAAGAGEHHWAFRARAGDGAERGSATVLVLALALALVCCAAVPLAAAALCADRARAAAAADLAALAAASASPDLSGGAPAVGGCALATRVASAQGAQLLECRAIGVADVLVEVGVPLPGWVPGAGSGLVRARSRAGPADDPGPR